jgi:hypothetical protein
MSSANKKVSLFLDKCPAHPPGTTVLKNIRVTFFPTYIANAGYSPLILA